MPGPTQHEYRSLRAAEASQRGAPVRVRCAPRLVPRVCRSGHAWSTPLSVMPHLRRKRGAAVTPRNSPFGQIIRGYILGFRDWYGLNRTMSSHVSAGVYLSTFGYWGAAERGCEHFRSERTP